MLLTALLILSCSPCHPHPITQPQEQQGRARPPQQAHDTEEREEVDGLEQDCGLRSGDEPGASPQPAHADCKLLPCSTASSSKDHPQFSSTFQHAQDNHFLTADSRRSADTGLGTSLVSFQFKDEGGVGKPFLLAQGHKPWPAPRCSDSVKQEILLLLLRSEPGKELCHRAELWQLLTPQPCSVLQHPARCPGHT